MDRKFPLYNRLGIHYPAGQENFRNIDLQAWKPILAQTGAGWLILEGDTTRAIPETFIRGLLECGVQPVLHFKPSLDPAPAPQDFELLLNAYAKWGLRYVILFDRPNTRSAWPPSGWTKNDLVERFLDRFLPLAEIAWQAGISPILPPLEPGGSYWDTAFLRTALTTLQRRKPELVRGGLALSAYAWTHGRSLNWGAGGPERSPSARPYLTPAGSQDQRGFRIFDWYNAVAQAALGAELPILLLEAGSSAGGTVDNSTAEALARLLARGDAPDPANPENTLDPIPDYVFAASARLPGGPQEESFLAISDVLQHVRSSTIAKGFTLGINGSHPIQHYLLLPSFEWGISEWHLDAIKPFVRKYRPAVGFSIEEAALAADVTVIGTENEIPEGALEKLRQIGCKVERIEARGTSLASILAER
jgi:hypothetical protein